MRGDLSGIIAPSTALPDCDQFDGIIAPGVDEQVRLTSRSRSRRRQGHRGHAKLSERTLEMNAVLLDVLAAFPTKTLKIAGELADKILMDRSDD